MSSQLDDFLAGRSSLTEKQIERVRLWISRENERDVTGGSEPLFVSSGVSEGAYYRVLSQARENVNQALYTLLLSSRMGLIRVEDLKRLLDLVSRAPSEAPEGSESVISLVDALVKKIVML